jgi:hypothetical protein
MSKVLQQDLQPATLSPHERLRLEVQRNHLQLSFRQSIGLCDENARRLVSAEETLSF